MRKEAVVWGLTSLACGALVPAQQAVHAGDLTEVVVKGQLLRPDEAAYTVTVLSNEEIRLRAPNDVDELFRAVPGMAIRDLQLGTVANSIVIRGFGDGGHGGDLGAVIDGIPLNEAMSHADGYVDLNVIIPLEIDSFAVYKGPVSALYGNYNRGGLINVQTRKGGDYAQADLAIGSFGTADLQGAYGGTLGGGDLNLAGRVFRTDGFRPQSGTRRGGFSGRWATDVTRALQVALSTRYVQAESDSASYLTAVQFRTDPRGVDPNVQNDGADKKLLTARVDVSYVIADDLKLLTFGYTTQQDFTRWFTRPVDAVMWRQREETYERTVYGAGASLNGVATPGSTHIKYVAGVEAFREATDYKFFDGLDRRRRVLPARSDREAKLNSVSAFAEIEANLHRLARAYFGLRADRFTGGCRRLGPETGGDPCGPLNEASHVSPKLGLQSSVTDWLVLRASWSEGFALANGFVKYSIGGQPLDETVFRQTEVGLSLSPSDAFELDVAAYRLRSSGEVAMLSPGVYENYGATLRKGVEVDARWRPSDLLELSTVYGLTDAEIERNIDARLVGLSVPGVPERTARFEAAFSPTPNWTVLATWSYVGAYKVGALNTLRASSYGLLDLGVAYKHRGAHDYRVYARVDNVTDRKYATSVALIGGQPLFAPGAPRSVQAGLQFDF